MISFLASLDTFTLKIVAVLVMLLTFASAFMLRLTLPGESYTRLWAGGSGLVFLGMMGGALREQFPAPLLIPVTNALVAAGGVMFSNGVGAFCERRGRQWPVAGIGGAIFLFFFIFTYLHPNLSIRVSLISLLYAALCVRMSWLLWVHVHPSMLLAQRVTAAFIGLEVLQYGFAIVGTLVPPSAAQFMDAPAAYNAAYLNSIILFVCLIFALTGLTNRRLQLRLEHLAKHDMLTGTLNRHAIEEVAQHEIARSQRLGQLLSVIALDIDHFKEINDRHGHQAGDNSLRLFAQAIKSQLRRGDIIGRIGGEEFCVLLPDTDGNTALTIAERLRITAEAMSIPAGDVTINLTTSAGLATLAPGMSTTWSQLLHLADLGLYEAKRGGRNRVIKSDPAKHALAMAPTP